MPTGDEVVVRHGGHTVARTTRAIRVLETSQPPAFYLPPDDVDLGVLTPSDSVTVCEWKGPATYWNLAVPGSPVVTDAAWCYRQPHPRFASIDGYLAFYAQKVDECWVDGERVEANEGSFYGGWITSKVVGPFKGGPGSWGW
jgi:uncharacterized protein (DUF427 family)